MTSLDLARYRRHLTLPEVGVLGQEAFAAAKVLIVGVGGLGSPAAMYLAAAGVGTIGLVDRDYVDQSNLQRQILYRDKDVGRRKLRAAVESLGDVNREVRVEPYEVWLDRANALDIISRYDLVLAGADNFAARYLVSDACVLARKPCVDGSIYRFEGQATVYDAAAGGPCYRCRFPAPPAPGSVPDCATAGVLGVVAGLIGCIQAAEALKLILLRAGVSSPEPLVGRLLVLDALAMRFHEFRIDRDPACPICGDSPTITELVDYEALCGGHPERLAAEIGPAELAEQLAGGPDIALVDVREPWEWALCRLPGATLIPLGELDSRLDEVPADREVVVYCHAGVRSLRAAESLAAAGRRARSLRGGIDAWSLEVDATVRRY